MGNCLNLLNPFIYLPFYAFFFPLPSVTCISIAKVRRPGNATSTGILRKPISRIFHWQPSTVFCQKLGIPDELKIDGRRESQYPANSLSSISLEVHLLGAM